MADISLPYREDWSCSGFFGFAQTGIQYADNGIKGLRQYAPFDQGGWHKLEDLGTASLATGYDVTTSRVFDVLTATALSGGVGTYRLLKRLRCPRDFGEWRGITFMSYKSTNVGITSFTASIYRAGAVDNEVNGVDVLADEDATWQQMELLPTEIYLPGDFITVELTWKVTATGGLQVWVGDWIPNYVTDRGNI